jgi:hypothetical protein
MYPKLIEKRYPLLRGKELTQSEFLSESYLLNWGTNEYYFDEKSVYLAPYAYAVEKAISASLSESQKVSYNIMMINTAYKHEEQYIEAISEQTYGQTKSMHSISSILQKKIYRLYILHYMMCIEEMLSPDKASSIQTGAESAKLVKSVR